MNKPIKIDARKRRDLLIPALQQDEGSTVVIDPKGQLAAVCRPYIVKRGKRVFTLNPLRIPASGEDEKSRGWL